MSNCPQFDESLWEAAAGNLSPELKLHLVQCTACRDELTSRQGILKGCTALQEVDAPDPVDTIHERLFPPRRAPQWRPALVAGVAVLFLLTVLILKWQSIAPVQNSPVISQQVDKPDTRMGNGKISTQRNTPGLSGKKKITQPVRKRAIKRAYNQRNARNSYVRRSRNEIASKRELVENDQKESPRRFLPTKFALNLPAMQGMTDYYPVERRLHEN